MKKTTHLWWYCDTRDKNVWLSSTDRPKSSARPKSMLLFHFCICPLKTLRLSMKSQTNKIKCYLHEKNQLICGGIVILETNKTVPFDYVIHILFIFAFILLFQSPF